MDSQNEYSSKLKHVLFYFCMLCLLLNIVSCTLVDQKLIIDTDMALKKKTIENVPQYPAVDFIVFSDPHLYDKSNGTEGQAFKNYLANDRKLLIQSEEILMQFVNDTTEFEADFVLVSGDLTKDGELNSHHLMVTYLRQIEESGKPVYIIPGNHDILNGLAEKYVGDETQTVENVSPLEFAQIYADFGFAEAIYADPNSLSYIVEPVEGLWLLAIDSCRYMENEPGKEHIVAGKFQQETLQWIEDKLVLAAREGKAVMTMMHHGVLEHYSGQKKFYSEYVVDDYEKVSHLLASYNVRLVFTGHYHAQDITMQRWSNPDKFLFDIETGSLITYPSPYRFVNISESQEARFQSFFIQSIPSRPKDLSAYANQFTHERVASIASRTIQEFKGNQEEAEVIGSQVADAFLAHFQGDEKLKEGQEIIRTQYLSIPAWFIVTTRKAFVYGLWHDLEPADNNLTIDLSTGNWE